MIDSRMPRFGKPKIGKAIHVAQKKSLWLITSVFRGFFILGMCFIILYPILLRLSTSFMPLDDIYDMSVKYVPKSFTFDNYVRLWKLLDMGKAYLSTIVFCAAVAILQVASSVLTGYGFARFHFKGKGPLFAVVLLGLILPPDLTLVPIYTMFSKVNLIDNPLAFIILSAGGAGIKSGLYIFMMRQYYRGMPKELEEAAFIDGAGLFRTFVKIMLPASRTMMTTIFLFSFVWQWLDVSYSSVFFDRFPVITNTLMRIKSMTVTVNTGIGSASELSLLKNAGILYLVVPLILFYIFAQRHFVESIERSGLVG